MNKMFLFLLPILAGAVLIGLSTPCTEFRTYELTGIAISGGPFVHSDVRHVAPSAFKKDIASLDSGEMFVPLLLDHTAMVDSIVGKVTKIWIDGDMVRFTAEIRDIPENRLLINKIKSGEVVGISIGFVPVKTVKDTFTEINLLEISIVYLGADQAAQIETFKIKGEPEVCINPY